MISLFNKHPSQAPRPSTDGDGIVRVSARSLIALHHGAQSLSLNPTRIRALQSGAYISPFKGRGMEFDEVRAYMAGDDVRTLDWRVTARTGRPHTKLFREERERTVLLWVDLRRPMFFATRGAYKAVRAAQAAALLGWSAIHHGDRLGGLIFSEADHLEVRPRRGKQALLHLMQKLADDGAWEGNDAGAGDGADYADVLQQSLLRLRRVAQPGSLIFLFSDFAGLDRRHATHVANLSRHCDLVLVALHDPLDQELPPAGRYRVGDGQRFLTIDTAVRTVREQYRKHYAAHQLELQRLCRRHSLYRIDLGTGDDPLTVLRQGLGGKR
jgi:uncharacterized protein (DUF58 family)